jgi:hypothetical protein
MNDTQKTLETAAAMLMLVLCAVLYVASVVGFYAGQLPLAFPTLFCGCACVASVLAIVAVSEIR